MSDYTLDTFEVNGFTVKIEIDMFGGEYNPHKDDESPGCALVMWGRNWDFPNDAGINLDSSHSWREVADKLLHPFAVIDEDDGEVIHRFATEDEASAVIDRLPDNEDGYGIDAEDTEAALIVLPVWVYEHSGISLRAGTRSYPFDDRWDSAQAGVAYITPTIWAYLSNDPWTGSDDQIERATKSIVEHVEVYGHWCNGDIYRYLIEDFDGEYIDSVGDWYDYDECEAEARSVAENTEHQLKCTGHLDRPSGEIEHDDRSCPIHFGE